MKPIQRAKTLAVFLLFFFAQQGTAKNTEFIFNSACIEASRQISLMKLKTATALLNQEKTNHPNNCAVDYLENYIDFYTLITEQNAGSLKILEKNKAGRISRFEQLPATSPYRLYAQAEINLQWAFSRIFQQEYFTAALEFRESYRLLERNVELFPFFTQNFKNTGVIKAMLGSIPENFKWVLNIVGMEGDFRQGIDLLGNFASHQSFAPDQILEKQSAEYYYTLLQLSVGDKNECWRFCERTTTNYSTNLLSCYLRAFIALKTGHNDIALEALNHQPTGPDYAPFPLMYYLKGKAVLFKQEINAALYFKKFVSFTKGQDMIKDAYKHLSWISLLSGDMEKFHIYQNMIKRFGTANTEEDKVALKEAQEQFIPETSLLKARLLYDGGYYERALEEMPVKPLSRISDQIESAYRYGRIYGELKQYPKAIEHYENCIRISGNNSHLHFAPFSCNQLGVIHEQLGNKAKAIAWYQKATTYKNYPYRSSTINMAKIALQRLK
ncbi:MAG: tetratricopeptide repeat protein [Bacteroidia bacterium]|jgi:tetratricopeptide (TPR) repeat protein